MPELHDLSSMPALLMVGLLLAALIADMRKDLCRLISGRNIVLCAIGSWYLLEAVMLPEALRDYTQGQYNVGLIHVGLALFGFLTGYHYTSGCLIFRSLAEKITFFD